MVKLDPRIIIGIAVLVVIIIGGGTAAWSTSLSGYQSITAEWYKVRWPNAQGTEFTLEWPKSGTIVQWDGDDTQDKFVDGMTDLNTYSAETEQPKYSHNINYNDWWINDTVTSGSPTGTASHYEWAIDIYTLNVNFRVTAGYGGCQGVEFWLEMQNNFDSVFKVLGAEEAASYIIFAQTENYTWTPTSAPHHIILPTVSNFELFFLTAGETVSPGIPENGSDLDFDKLTPYSHVGIRFVFDDFGAGWGETQPTVNMLVELNVLTLGRFDYVLSYVEGGEDEAAPMGNLGAFDSIGAALDAGFGAMLDGMTGMGLGDINWTLVIIVIALVIVFYIIIKLTVFRRVSGGGGF
jgi:hypothetical protein